MLAGATAIPDEIERAGGSLGANRFRTLRHVVVPMARRG
jgi:ABC-type Fe3+ transport system permease subunit